MQTATCTDGQLYEARGAPGSIWRPEPNLSDRARRTNLCPAARFVGIEPGPFQGFRTSLLDRWDQVRAVTGERRTQTYSRSGPHPLLSCTHDAAERCRAPVVGTSRPDSTQAPLTTRALPARPPGRGGRDRHQPARRVGCGRRPVARDTGLARAGSPSRTGYAHVSIARRSPSPRRRDLLAALPDLVASAPAGAQAGPPLLTLPPGARSIIALVTPSSSSKGGEFGQPPPTIASPGQRALHARVRWNTAGLCRPSRLCAVLVRGPTLNGPLRTRSDRWVGPRSRTYWG